MKTLFPFGFVLFAAVVRAADPVASFRDAVARGQPSLNLRLRGEDVEQTGLRDATAVTLRTRLGFTTAPFAGWQAMAEATNIVALDANSYSQAGLNAGGAGRAVVADPTGTALDQAWLRFAHDATSLTAGRQRLVLDNARFVGDSGWRQNWQTFDAVVLRDKTLEDTTLTYAFVDRVNRVFGDRHPQGYWRSASHLFNASYAGLPAGTLTGYVYLLDFRGAGAPNSCATYGVSFAGEAKLPAGWKVGYRAELAQQADYGHSAPDYSAGYRLAEIGGGNAAATVTLGYEVLGSDHNVGFKTPLATLHAFDGWADLFLTTPAAGLRDTYVKLAGNLPGKFTVQAWQHWFALEAAGTAPGREFDVLLSRKFGARVTGLVKFADFRRDSAAYPDVRKAWAQVEFNY